MAETTSHLPCSNDEARDLAMDEGKKKELFRKWNNIAMTNFMMVFTLEALMRLVFKGQSPVCKVARWESKFGCQGLVGKVNAQGLDFSCGASTKTNACVCIHETQE
jgi:hypothetical protein